MKKISTLLTVVFSLLLFISCNIEPLDPSISTDNTNPVDPNTLPVLTTNLVSNITTTTATSGGDISDDGGSPIIARGVVWGINSNPTISNSKTIDGTGIGSFTSSIINLTSGNTYYVRAYATNANGTSYGNQISFSIANSSGFAMTAKINGLQFQANNPFGTNEFSSTNIWSYYPLADFVMLQGRQGGLLGNPEINIWLKRTDIVVGSYNFGAETFTTTPSHFIDLIDNSTADNQYTESGTITITEVNSTTKTVKGTFEFSTVNEPNGSPTAVVNNVVTEGTFNYIYMN